MPTRLCNGDNGRCPNPATYRGKCAAHATQRERDTDRAGKQVYNTKRWQMVRRRVLFLNPLCNIEGCDEIATDVHHKVDLRDGGKPYDQANLQALCKVCHSRITRTNQGVATP